MFEQDFHVLIIYRLFLHNNILLSPIKVKVKIKICKKSIYHDCRLVSFRHCKSNIIFNNTTKL